MVTCNMNTIGTDTWIKDSGASDHMTSSLDNLLNFKPTSPNLIIKLPTGDTTKISDIGDVKLTNGLLLHKVLYVPQFKHILISIYKMAKDNHCVVNFQPQTCEILDPHTKIVKATAHLYKGLYYLK